MIIPLIIILIIYCYVIQNVHRFKKTKGKMHMYKKQNCFHYFKMSILYKIKIKKLQTNLEEFII